MFSLIFVLLATVGMLVLGFAIFLFLAEKLPGKWVVLIWLLNIPLGLVFFMRLENSEYIAGLYILAIWAVGLVGGALVLPVKIYSK